MSTTPSSWTQRHIFAKLLTFCVAPPRFHKSPFFETSEFGLKSIQSKWVLLCYFLRLEKKRVTFAWFLFQSFFQLRRDQNLGRYPTLRDFFVHRLGVSTTLYGAPKTADGSGQVRSSHGSGGSWKAGIGNKMFGPGSNFLNKNQS